MKPTADGTYLARSASTSGTRVHHLIDPVTISQGPPKNRFVDAAGYYTRGSNNWGGGYASLCGVPLFFQCHDVPCTDQHHRACTNCTAKANGPAKTEQLPGKELT